MGGSLAIIGAAAQADAVGNYDGEVERAFREYNEGFRPYIETVQANTVRNLDLLVPKAEEAVGVGTMAL